MYIFNYFLICDDFKPSEMLSDAMVIPIGHNRIITDRPIKSIFAYHILFLPI